MWKTTEKACTTYFFEKLYFSRSCNNVCHFPDVKIPAVLCATCFFSVFITLLGRGFSRLLRYFPLEWLRGPLEQFTYDLSCTDCDRGRWRLVSDRCLKWQTHTLDCDVQRAQLEPSPRLLLQSSNFKRVLSACKMYRKRIKYKNSAHAKRRKKTGSPLTDWVWRQVI